MNLKKVLESKANPERAKLLGRYFKTGKGEYGEGDFFLGIPVPVVRKIAKDFKNIEIEKLQEHLNSEIHEERLVALLILLEKNRKAGEEEKEKIFDFYLKNAARSRINNWDLVDLSCRDIVGEFLLNKDRKILYELSHSNNLWERRISIISTSAFIRKNQFSDTLKISEILLRDKHDLMHKAVGWMLREVGKKDEKALMGFLDRHYKIMPRTMLRYAIEKFPEKERKSYLNGEV